MIEHAILGEIGRGAPDRSKFPDGAYDTLSRRDSLYDMAGYASLAGIDGGPILLDAIA
jgi:hypothetical protein